MKQTIVTLGELLIDFTPAGLTVQGHPLYEQNPGGAPANVAAAVARLGGKSALIAAVGNDFFGDFLVDVLLREGVDTSGLQRVETATTTLAFVSLNEQGDRSFCFARKPGADMLLSREGIPGELLQRCGIFHFGSISLGAASSRAATLFAADAAKKAGALISYDPNWRESLWGDRAEGLAAMRTALSLAQVLKLSEEEHMLLSGTEDLAAGTLSLLREFPSLRLIVVTRGQKGCFYRLGDKTDSLATYDVAVADTTGAGDAFWGCLLGSLCENPRLLDGSISLEASLRRANAAGSLCATGRGAISALPTKEEIDRLVATGKFLKI